MSIKKLFAEIPRTYELINHILTLGLDAVWRKKASQVASQGGGKKWLDVCSGTGQMAAYLHRRAEEKTTVFALDFCFSMLREVKHKPEANRIFLCVADVGSLPFADDTFDLVTISFATRNININRGILLGYLQEFRRIIKPGGRLVNLETSQPGNIFLRKLFHLYVNLVVTPVGCLLSGSKAAYSYLAYTLPRFFAANELSDIFYRSGFTKVFFSYMTFGVIAIHTAIK